MKNNQNFMILNGIDIGISEIELNKSDLLITDKSRKYCLQVYVAYNWKDINSIEIGKKKNIDFNEYCFSENNEPALIWPTECFVQRITKDTFIFSINFSNLVNETHYMSKRGHFDIKLRSFECNVFIDFNDAIGDSIRYEFK